jgi:hypothetical protein
MLATHAAARKVAKNNSAIIATAYAGYSDLAVTVSGL